MIRIPLPWLVFTGLLIFLAGIFFVWICYEIARRFKDSKMQRSRIRCRICSFDFKADRQSPLPRCPQCGGLNEHEPARIF